MTPRDHYEIPFITALCQSKSLTSQLWWRFMPGVRIKVRWPKGNIIVNHDDPRWRDLGGAVWVDLGYSTDPNDHYRWWLEKHVGRQGVSWDWDLLDDDARQGRLTIKIRRGREKFATLAAIQWA